MAKGPSKETPGDGTSAFVLCQSPPLDETLTRTPILVPLTPMRMTAADHGGDACSRLEKMVLSHDR